MALLGAILPSPARAKPADAPKAEFHLTGLGWWGDHEMRVSLERLLGDQRGATVDANAIEDAAFLLVSAIADQGFLKPVIEIEFTSVGGEPGRFKFDATLATPLPRPLAAKTVTFHVTEGARYVVDAVRIDGLTALPMKTAREYFQPDKGLFGGGEARAYAPSRLTHALDALSDELRRRGQAEAQVRAREVNTDDRTGKVGLVIEVVEGPRWDVVALRFVGAETSGVALDFGAGYEHRLWSPLWQQDVRERVRQAFYQAGFPDMTVVLSAQAGAEQAGVKPVEVTATIAPGPRVRVGQVRFEGNERTHEAVLRRRVPAAPGDPLDPRVFEQASHGLSRLGVFRKVDLRYDPADGAVRDPVFALEEGRRWDASWLVGYGSYEQARTGVELRQMNLFGRAHQTRLELVESMKSSRGEYDYTVPELFGESIDGTAKLFGLQRQEPDFRRKEYGATFELKRSLPWFSTDATLGYTFQSLRNTNNDLSTSSVDQKQVDVASVDLGLSSDRRDSPLRPRRGGRSFVRIEVASRDFGGQTDYQRLELGAAYHTAWGSGRWIHVGFTHGVILTQGAGDDALLPVNKRFFPGGDGSIRGYQVGEASPRGADGRFLGAKTYLLANLELEQALTSTWSAVVFGDALGMATRLAHYPFDEKLYSIGIGVRYQTLIGPVRIEYGRNVNPRPGDPGGTLQIAVGVPF
jgi:outer membrane protein insertion porin family